MIKLIKWVPSAAWKWRWWFFTHGIPVTVQWVLVLPEGITSFCQMIPRLPCLVCGALIIIHQGKVMRISSSSCLLANRLFCMSWSWRWPEMAPDSHASQSFSYDYALRGSNSWSTARPPSFSSSKPSCGFSAQPQQVEQHIQRYVLGVIQSLSLIVRKLRNSQREHLWHDDHVDWWSGELAQIPRCIPLNYSFLGRT